MISNPIKTLTMIMEFEGVTSDLHKDSPGFRSTEKTS